MTIEDLIQQIRETSSNENAYCEELINVFLQEQKEICSLYVFPTRYSAETRYNIKKCYNVKYIGMADDIQQGKLEYNYKKR
tara:strand:+ start:211 stop:453 length:243 start_codon:yes stop_codon:yes gene_type:complete